MTEPGPASTDNSVVPPAPTPAVAGDYLAAATVAAAMAVKLVPPEALSEKTLTAAKARTGRIPKPTPRDRESTVLVEPVEEPLSTSTISLKRPNLTQKSPLSAQDLAPRQLKIFCWKCAQKLDLSDMEAFRQINCPSCGATIIVPKWFDNYLLEERGGEGGMALVYRGLDLALDREVAIKVLSPSLAKEEQKGTLFLHEARTAATLNHYAVLPIYTCGEYGGQPYIVMQWMAGGSLDLKLEKDPAPLPLPEVVKWIRDIAEGLDNARRHGIIHHDVKPANIMLDAEGNVKIGDFGISQALHDSRSAKISAMTKSWASPHYVSPEKVTTGKETYLGDIYSLGATFFHLATGRTPFADEADIDRLFWKHVESDPPSPKSIRADLPESLSRLILAMMARTPETRPSYRDIINDLNVYLKTGGRLAPIKSSFGEPHAGASAAVAAKLQGKLKPRPFSKVLASPDASRNRGTLTVAIVLAAMVVLGGIGILVISQGGEGSSRRSYAGVPDYLPTVTRAFAAGDSRQAMLLAEQVIDDAQSSLPQRRQAALQAALAVYLNREDAAGGKCRLIAGRLVAAGDTHAGTFAIIHFLSGYNDAPATARSQLRNDDAGLQAALAMAVMLAGLYERVPQDQIQLNYSAYHQAALQLPPDHWAVAWRGRIGAWIDWIMSGQGARAQLEPLIVSFTPPEVGELPETVSAQWHDPGATASSSPPPPPPTRVVVPVGELTAEWLANDRKFAAGRPKPVDYNFNAGALREYMAQLPYERREGESRRSQQVSSLKPYLCKMMMRFSFESKEIRLRDGRQLNGSIMANANILSIRVAGAAERLRVNWGQVPVEQMAAFVGYYAQLRLKASAGEVTDQERSLEGARDYLRAALLYDWYGNYAAAVESARQAIATDARTAAEVQKLLME